MGLERDRELVSARGAGLIAGIGSPTDVTESSQPLGKNLCRLFGDLFDGCFDISPARAEAQHAESREEAAVLGAACHHHLAAGVDPLEQPVGRVVSGFGRSAWRHDAKGEERELRRGDHLEPGHAGELLRGRDSQCALFGDRGPNPGGAVDFERQPDPQARKSS